MKRLLCCIMALTMIGSATAFAAEPVDNSAIAEKALSEVTALYEDLYTITNAEAEVQNSTYDDMGNIIVDVVVSFDRTIECFRQSSSIYSEHYPPFTQRLLPPESRDIFCVYGLL